MFCSFGHKACGILVLQPAIEPTTPMLEVNLRSPALEVKS